MSEVPLNLRLAKLEIRVQGSAVERGGNNLKGFKDFRIENVSSQGQHLALTGSFFILPS